MFCCCEPNKFKSKQTRRLLNVENWRLVISALTLRGGGNVLVPVHPSGVTYDLFECLSNHLESCGLMNVPLYFISPVAKSSLAYSNIYAEWSVIH